MPDVSVLMPVYNAMPYLRAACAGILDQTGVDFEFIALNDASTDGSGEYLDGLNDARMRVVHLPKAGYVVNLNIGLGLCRAPLVARMDADDVSLPGRLARQVAFLHDNPDAVAVGCQAETIDRDDRVTGVLSYDTSDLMIRHRLLSNAHLPHPGVMYRRHAVLDAGGYNADFMPCEDYDLWCRLAERGRLANLDETFLRYRTHSANISVTRADLIRKWRPLISRRYQLAAGYASSEAEADEFFTALNGTPAALTARGAAACRAVWQRFLSVAVAPPEEIDALRVWLRRRALESAGQCGPARQAFYRWVRLARSVDPAGMRWDRLARRASKQLLGTLTGATRT